MKNNTYDKIDLLILRSKHNPNFKISVFQLLSWKLIKKTFLFVLGSTLLVLLALSSFFLFLLLLSFLTVSLFYFDENKNSYFKLTNTLNLFIASSEFNYVKTNIFKFLK
jgi:hypothetical protein